MKLAYLKLNRIVSLTTKVLVGVLSFLLVTVSYANPVFNNTAYGQVNITQTPHTTVINQSSQKVILNWNSFNIGQGESTHFQQPRGGIALNRISSEQGPSSIYGSLTATGQIILLNPAGIYFGPSAYVNVGGLIATTANITNQNFIQGNYIFNETSASGSVINEGQIIAARHGLVALLGPTVINHGLIQANIGHVVLASGDTYTMQFGGNELISFGVSGKSIGGIANSGTLRANGGRVLVTAGGASAVLDNVINMGGVVEAKSVSQHKGEIIFSGGDTGVVRVAANINVSGKKSGHKGGTVKITGQKILIDSPTVIDASGDAGGGNIFIGGNAHGAGPLSNASATVVAPNARLIADAIRSGNGGNIVVWSNDLTKVYGDLTAHGGSLSGNGGFIETSSHNYLDVNGTSIDTSAPHGVSGEWLLDPTDITISTGSTTAVTSTSTSFTANTSSSVLNVGDLTNALANNSVTVKTNSSGSGGTGNITVSTPISWANSAGSNATTLTLDAYTNIIINSAISSSNGGSLSLIAGNGHGNTGSITFNAGVSLPMGTLTLKAPATGSGGSATIFAPSAASTIAVLNFDLTQGYWKQVGSPLPSFSVTNNFQLNSGNTLPSGAVTFIRATGGDGTSTNSPYTIVDVYGLQGIASNTALQLNTFWQMGGDIDASGTSGWNSGAGFVPIGNSSNAFHGTFKGAGYKIINLYINRPTTDQVGLFARVNGTVENVNLSNASITGLSNVGGLVGDLIGGTVTNSSVSGSIQGGTAGNTSGIDFGGLVGYSTGTISGSSSSASVTGTYNYVGGLVGHVAAGSVNTSFSTGNVNSTWNATAYGSQADYMGGLVGGNDGTITTSYSSGTVTGGATNTGYTGGSYDYVGGFVGNNPGTINDAYSTSIVYGGNYVGGFVGFDAGTIDRAYATGSTNGFYITSGDSIIMRPGGFAGSNEVNPIQFGSISNSFWDVVGTGQGGQGNNGTGINFVGTGLSNLLGGCFDGNCFDTDHPSVLAAQTTYTSFPSDNWNFTNTWYIPNYGDTSNVYTRPFLRMENTTSITNAHQLQMMAMSPSSAYTLQNNITFSGAYSDMWGNQNSFLTTTYGFVPVGNPSNNFTGSFKGGNFTIANLTISHSGMDNVGLIGYSSSSDIENLTLSNVSISGRNNVGAVVGDYLGTKLTNIAVTSGSVTGNDDVGGIVGLNSGTIQKSYISPSNVVTGSFNTGGFVGENGGAISNSYSQALVIGITPQSGSSGDIGGFVGSNTSSGTIQYTYATGYVANPNGLANIGGFAGANTGTLTANFWDTATSGRSTGVAFGTGSVAAGTFDGSSGSNLTSQSTFSNAGWAFPTTWSILPGQSYPYLTDLLSSVRAISGTSGASGGVTATVAANGSNLDYTYTGNNGFFYFLEPNNASSQHLLVYLGSAAPNISGNGVKGNAVVVGPANTSISGSSSGLTIASNVVAVGNGLSGTYSNSDLNTALGTLNSTDILYSFPVSVSNIVLGNGSNPNAGFTTTANTTYNLDGNITASGTGSLTFSGPVNLNTTVQLKGVNVSLLGTTTLGSNSLTVYNTGNNSTISGGISGSGSFTKDGSGTVLLSNTNTYTGTTTVSNGTLKIGSSSAVPTTNLAINNAAIFDLNNNDATIAALSGTGFITNSGGTFHIFTTNTSSVTAFSGRLTGNLNFTKTGSGELDLTSTTPYTNANGTLGINGGTLVIANVSNLFPTTTKLHMDSGVLSLTSFDQTFAELAGITGNGGGIIVNGHNFTINQNTNTSWAGLLEGTMNFAKKGTGTLTFTNGGTGSGVGSTSFNYIGSTTVSGGVLQMGADYIIDPRSILILENTATGSIGGSIYDLNDHQGVVYAIKDGSNALGEIRLGSTTGGALTTVQNDTSSYTFTGKITGTGTLTKSGSTGGIQVLAGNNDYVGLTTVSGGTLSITSSSALGDTVNGTTVNSGATLDLNGTLTIAEPITLVGATLSSTGTNTITSNIDMSSASTFNVNSGTLTTSGTISGIGNALNKSGTGTLIINHSNTYSGNTNINVGTLQLAISDVISDLSSVNISSGAIFDLHNNDETIAAIIDSGNTSLGSGTLTVSSNGLQQTYSGVMSGTGNFVKNGTNTVTLSGNNTYTGSTTINSGTLQMGIANALSSSTAVTLANNTNTNFDLNSFNQTIGSLSGGGTSGGNVLLTGTSSTLLTFGDNNNTSFNGVISGSGGLNKQGTGTVSLTNTNTYGTSNVISTTVTNGILALGSSSSGTITSGPIGIGNLSLAGGSLISNIAGGVTIANPYIVAGNASISGSNPITLSGTGTFNNGKTLTVNNTNNTVLSGNLNGSGSLVENAGAGTLIISGADNSNYSGNSTLTSGILQIGVATNALGSIGTLALNGGTLQASVATTLNNSFTVGGNAAIGGSSNIILSNSGVLGSGILTVNNTAITTLSSTLIGTGGLTLNADTLGTLILSGVNAYSGATTLTNGILEANNANHPFGTGVFNLNGGTLQAINVGGTTLVNSSFNVGSGASVVIGGVQNITFNNSGSLPNFLFADAASNLTVTNTGTTSFNGMSNGGANALTENAIGGTVSIGGNNSTFSGGVTLNGGTLQIANDNINPLGTGALNLNGGILRASVAVTTNPVTNNFTVSDNTTIDGTNNISISGTGNLSSGVLTVSNTGSTTLSGALSNSGSLTQTAGVLTLSGINSGYSGITTVSGGTLIANNNAALGSGTTTVNSGGTLNIPNGISLGTLTTLNLNGNGVSGNGVLTGTGTTPVIGSGVAVVLSSDSTIGVANSSDNLTINSVMSGTKSLTKVGAGTLTLGNVNTYSGTTIINAGTLFLNTGAALSNQTKLVLANTAGALLNLNNNSQTVSGLSGGGPSGGNIALGSQTGTTLSVVEGGSENYQGVISGSGGFALGVGSTGTLKLSGANTYGGTTSINDGILELANNSAISSGIATVSSGTLQLDGITINNAINLNGAGKAGASGALVGTDTSTVNGNLTLISDSTLGTIGDTDAFTLGGTINGAHALTTAGPGAITFGNTVGNSIPLASLTTSNSGTAKTNINTSSITTSGNQIFNNSITLQSDSTLTSSGASIAFASAATINGAKNLHLLSSTGITINGRIGGTTPLTSLKLGDGSTDILSNDITTTGNQIYDNAVAIGASITLTSTAGTISFAKTVDSTVDGANTLTLSSALSTSFNDVVGGNARLAGLTVGGGSTDAINTSAVTTLGSQIYNDALTLTNAGDTTLAANGESSDIILGGGATWSTANTVVLSAGRNIIINGPISGTNGTLQLSSGQAITSNSAATVNVKNFNLLQGQWIQVGTLPSFSVANNFQINSGSIPNNNVEFLRAAGGSGTSIDPYQIQDVYGLQGLGSNVTTLGYSYVMNNDINGNVTSNWNSSAGFIPIGTFATPFTGSLNGNAYVAKNLTINFPTVDGVGLFGATSAAANITQVGVAASTIIGQSDVGALVGFNAGNISLAYSTGSVTSSGGGANVGGLVGGNSGTITNTYSQDSVSGGTSNNVGGLIGNNSGTLNTSYSAGKVTGSGSSIGGLIGVNNGTVPSNNYWDIDKSGQATSAAGTGEPTASMQQQATFSGWDFTTVWGINEGMSYPFLLPFNAHQRNISGIAYSDQGITPIANATVVLIADGVTIGSALTDVNGVFNFSESSGTIADSAALLLYLTGVSTKGDTIALAPLGGGSLSGLKIESNNILVDGSALTASNTFLSTAKGALNSTDILYSVSGALLTLANFTNTIVNLITTATTIYTVDGAISTVNGGTSSAYFGGAVILNAGVSTVGSQTYAGAVTLASNAVLTAAGGADITFGSTVNGAHHLTVNASGNTTFNNAVGAGNALASITTDAGGVTNINSTIVNTTGTQTYNDAVMLGASGVTTITTHNSDIVFNNILDGTQGLTVAAGSGTVDFHGAIGSANASPTSLTSTGTGSVFFDAAVGTVGNGVGSINIAGATNINGGSVITSGSQTYNGLVTINGNTAFRGGDLAFNSINGTAGENLTVNTTGNSTINGVIGSNINDLVLNSINGYTGSLLLSSANTYAGNTSIDAGTLNAANNTALSAGNITVANGATLGLVGASLNIGNAITLNDGSTISDNNANSTNILSGAIALNGTDTVNVSNATNDNLILSNVLSGTGVTLIKGDVGTLILSGNNTYTSNTIVNNGILIANNANAFGNSAVTVNNGATVIDNNLNIANNNITLNGAGAAGTSGALMGIGDQAVWGGTITLGADSTIGTHNSSDIFTLANTINGTNNGGEALTLQGPGSIILNNTVGAGVPLANLTANATTKIANNITTTGDQVFNDPVVLLNSATLSSTAGALNFASTVDGAFDLVLSSLGSTTLGGTIGNNTPLNTLTINAASIAINGGSVSSTGNQIYHNTPITLGADTVLASNAGDVTSAGDIDGNNHSFTINNAGSSSAFSGALSNLSAFFKAGLGTLILSGNNTYTGDTSVTGGILELTSNTALGNSSAAQVQNNATLKLTNGVALSNALTLTLNGVGATGTNGALVVTGASPVTVNGDIILGSSSTIGTINAGDAIVLNGTISGSGNGLTLLGTGTFELLGANTYSGGTLNNGTLIVGTNTALGTGSVGLNGGILEAFVDNITLNNSFILSGDSAIGGVHDITLSGNGTIGAPNTLTINNTKSTTLSGNLNGSGSIIENTASGSLIISGTNNSVYSGIITLNDGTLQVGAASNALGTSPIVLNGGHLQSSVSAVVANDYSVGNGSAVTINGSHDLELSGVGSFGNSASLLTVTNTGNTKLTGTLTGTGSLVEDAGNGTLIVGSANTDNTGFTGNTTLTSGTLQIGVATNALGTVGTFAFNGGILESSLNTVIANDYTIGNGATPAIGGDHNIILSGNGAFANNSSLTDANSAQVTLSGSLSGPGSLIENASGGILILSGSNSFTGATTVTAGTMNLTNAAALGDALNHTSGVSVGNGATIELSNISLTPTLGLTLNGSGVGSAGALLGTGTSTWNGNILLGSDSTIGTSAAADALNLNGTIDGAANLILTGPGKIILSGVVGGTPIASLISNASTTEINTTNITTNGTQTYNNAVILRADTTLAANNNTITLATVDSLDTTARSLTLNTGTGGIILNGDIGGGHVLNQFIATDTGATNDILIAHNISTIGDIDITAGRNITLTNGNLNSGLANITLNGTNGFVEESGSGSTTAGAITGALLTANAATGITLNNVNNILSFNAVNSTGGDIALTNNGALNITGINQAVGNLSVTNAGVITQSAGIIVSGLSNFAAGAHAIDLSNANNHFVGAVSLSNSGNNNVAIINNTALTIGTSSVGSGTLQLTGVGVSQTGAIIQASGAGAVTINGVLNGSAGVINLANNNNQFTGIVSLNNSLNNNNFNVSLSNTGSLTLGAVTADSGTVSITNNGQLTTSGLISTRGGDVNLSVISSDVLTINGDINTARNGVNGGVINLTTANAPGAINLGANITSANGAINFNGPVNVTALSTVDAANGTITFANTVNGAGQTLVLQDNLASNGTVTFNDNVVLGALTTFAQPYAVIFNGVNNTFTNAITFANTAGVTLGNSISSSFHFNGGLTNTASTTQMIGTFDTHNAAISLGTITLAGDTSISAGAGTIELSAVSGNYHLGLDSISSSTLNGAINIGSLSLSGGGADIVNTGNINTSGNQSYGDALNLGTDVTFNAGGTISFLDINGMHHLSLISGAGTILGGSVDVTSLALSGGGIDTINTPSIITTGNQSYGDALVLGNNAVLSTGNGTIGFANSIDGAYDLTLISSHTKTINGAVGNASALASFTMKGGGQAVINTSVKTINDQTYADAATLAGDASFTSTLGNIFFDNTLDGPFNAIITSHGTTFFGNTVGTTALASLTVSGGAVDFNGGSVTTSGVQVYNAPVSLGGNTNFVGSSIALNNGVDGNQDLNLTGNNMTLKGTLAINNVSINGSGVNNSFTLDSGGLQTWNITGANTSNVVVSGVASMNLNNVQNLTGGNGNDMFNISGGTLSGSINGGAGNNIAVADNVANTWTITTSDGGAVTGISNGFANIQNLVGGNANDTFRLAGGTLSGSINDIGGTNTLIGNNVVNIWNINATDAGYVTGVNGGFNNIQNLTGGNSGNNFIFANNAKVTGFLNGGSLSSMNTLNFNAFNAPVFVNLISGIYQGSALDDTSSTIAAYANINNLIANRLQMNSLTLPSGNNNVVITGPLQGYVNDPLFFNGFTIVASTSGQNTVTFNTPGVVITGPNTATVGGEPMYFPNMTLQYNDLPNVLGAAVSPVIEQGNLINTGIDLYDISGISRAVADNMKSLFDQFDISQSQDSNNITIEADCYSNTSRYVSGICFTKNFLIKEIKPIHKQLTQK